MMQRLVWFLTNIIDLADSDGGHILILILLIEIFLRHNADAYLDLAIGALLMKLKDAGSNKNREVKYATKTMDVSIKETP